jgi:hypothetical protein
MPDGNDEELGACYDDQISQFEDGVCVAPDSPSGTQSQLPDHCYSDMLGWDDSCLDAWMIGNALESLWDSVFGSD